VVGIGWGGRVPGESQQAESSSFHRVVRGGRVSARRRRGRGVLLSFH
jgi:hypothetical protein